MRAALAAGLALGAGCLKDPPPPPKPALVPAPDLMLVPVADAAAAPVAPAARGSWFTFAGGTPVTVAAGGEEIDAVFTLDEKAAATLTVMRPMPGQADLASWVGHVNEILVEQPRATRTIAIDGIPAQEQDIARGLRWVFVADGFGGILICGGELGHAASWLHARCDPALAAFHVLHPVHD